MARILVVDDEPDERFLVRRLFERAGHEVRDASDGAEGMRAVQESAPDLVITDMMMPVMGGAEFIRQLRAEPATAGVLILVSSGDSHRAVGADATVPKSRSFGQLREAADALLGFLQPENPGGLEPLVAEIVRKVLAEQPAIVVLDSAKMLQDFATERQLRAALYDLTSRLARTDTVLLLLGEYTAGELESGIEFSLADVIIQVENEIRERIRSGIPGLDELMAGGMMQGDASLVMGPSGVGKTTLGMRWLAQGLEQGDHCLFVTLQDSADHLSGMAAIFGWDVAAARTSGQLADVPVRQRPRPALHRGGIRAGPRAQRGQDAKRRAQDDPEHRHHHQPWPPGRRKHRRSDRAARLERATST